MFNSIRELWQEFMMWHDKMIWNNSIERRELATKRLAIYRKYMSGDESCRHSPYTHPEEYEFF